MQACRERAFTFSIKFLWRVTYVVVQFHPWFKFCPFVLKLIIIHCHTSKQRGIKLNHNIYNPRISLIFWATELDMSTGLDKQIELRKPSSIRVYRSRSSRPVDISTSINPYQARFPELDLFIRGWLTYRARETRIELGCPEN